MTVLRNFLRRPGVAHILAANDRYNKRLGPQFAAAITYFSVLAMVPVLMFAVAVLGWTLTELRPDWFELVKNQIDAALSSDESVASSVKEVVDNAFSQWRGIGLVAFFTASYAGIGWIGNLKRAFRAMWRDDFSEASEGRNFVLEKVENFGIFLGMLLAVLVAAGLATGGTGFAARIGAALGLDDVPGHGVMLRAVSILLSFLALWMLFAFLFGVLPGRKTSLRTWLIGTITGAALVTLLQQAASILITVFTRNAAASVFGPLIILMLVLNVLATIILMIAAWVGTADTWEAEKRLAEAKKLADQVDDKAGVVKLDAGASASTGEGPRTPSEFVVPDEALARQRLAGRWASTRSAQDLREGFDEENPERTVLTRHVSPETAERGAKLALGTGYGLGTATGLGIGAIIASIIARITRD